MKNLPYEDLQDHLDGKHVITDQNYDDRISIQLILVNDKSTVSNVIFIGSINKKIEAYEFKPHFPRYPFCVKFRDINEYTAIMLAVYRSGLGGRLETNSRLVDQRIPARKEAGKDYYATVNDGTTGVSTFVPIGIRLIQFDDYFTPYEQYKGYHTGKNYGI